MEDYDNKFYENLKWMITNDAGILEYNFTETIDYFGKKEVKELKPGGKDITVTNENKFEYIELVAFEKLYNQIKSQVDNFLVGFYEIIPRKYIAIFDHKEIELLISGLPEIDIDDMKLNTDYKEGGYTVESIEIKWFWEIMYTLNS